MSYSACIHGGLCTGCMDCYEEPEEKVYICEDCGEEIDPDVLYEVGGEKLCRQCVLDRFAISA